MSLIETIRNKPEKTRQRIIAGISGFLVLVIVVIGWFVYEAPYARREISRESNLSDISRFRAFFSNSRQSADSFVEPIDQYFTQQNGDLSSQN